MSVRLGGLSVCLLLIVAALRADEPAGAKRPGSLSDKPSPPVACDGEKCQVPLAGAAAASAVSPEIRAVARANNDFAFALFAALPGKEENLLFSPLGVTTAMGMVYAGARGETADEIAAAMRFNLPQDKLHTALAGLQKALLAVKPGEENVAPKLAIANRLWGRKADHFQEPFLKLTREQYGAELAGLDFAGQPKASLTEINGWVAERTGHKIDKLLPPGAVDEQTRLVLTNAIYFNGKWATPFDKALTTPHADFLGFADEAGVVSLMQQDQDTYRYAKVDGVQILEKPYRGSSLVMSILLPETGQPAFAALRSALAHGKLEGWLAQIKERIVKVYLPKFHLSLRPPLADGMRSLGVRHAFDDKGGSADLSGINGGKDLFLSDFVHQADIAVDEEGTEASAATAPIGGFGAIPPRSIVFRADHPFVFLIRDMRTGCLLFLGQFTTPPPAQGSGGAF